MSVTKIFYKNDFPLRLHTLNLNGESIGAPPYDWVARFWTASKVNYFEASQTGGVLTNCRIVDGEIVIAFDNHHLSPGTLRVEFKALIPSDEFPDGNWKVVTLGDTGIELVSTNTEASISDIEATATLPYVKGEKGDKGDKGEQGDEFTYADFTPSQIAELQRPATEAVTVLAERETEFSQAEHNRDIAETDRAKSEMARLASENERNTNETARNNAEDSRCKAETLRTQAETLRSNAESTRQSNETSRQTAEQSRVSAETKRVEAETQRQSQFATAKTKAETAIEQANQAATYARGVGQSYAGGVEEAKLKVFVDLWNAACIINNKNYGRYNAETGLFELNSIKDLTYDEATYIYAHKDGNGDQGAKYQGVQGRTMFPLTPYTGMWGTSGNCTSTFRGCTFEDIVIDSSFGRISIVNTMFHFASKVKRITGLKLAANTSVDVNTFQGTPSAIYLELTLDSAYTNNTTLNFKYNELTLESWQFLVAKSVNHTGTITVKVPNNVYAKLTDEDNTEWHKVLTDAATKNISFATN